MTVINPNSVAGINSITVQSGNALSVHKSDGTLIRTITESSGISTFTSISVGSATTTNNADKSINIGLGASISSHADNSLTFGTGGDSRLVIDSVGRLIVGNTGSRNVGGSTTFSKFQIEGTSAVTSSISLVDNEPTSSSAFIFFGKSRGNSIGESGIVQTGDTLGGLSFIGADGNDLNNRTAEITAEVNGSPANNTIPTDLVFSTSNQHAGQLAERLRITSTGNINVSTAATIKSNGNATFSGIVTATSFIGDGSGLSGVTATTINSNANNRIITGSSSANTLNGESDFTFDGSNLIVGGSTFFIKNAMSDSNGLKLSQEANDTSQIFNHYQGPLLLGTSNTERLRIGPTGGVGISTDKIRNADFLHIATLSQDFTNPTEELMDGGGICFQTIDNLAATGRSFPGIFWSSNTAALGRARAGIIGVAANNNDATDIVFLGKYLPGGDGMYPRDERMRIRAQSGYVGINTSLPDRQLHIVGNDGPTQATSGNSDTILVLDNKGSNGAIVEFKAETNGAGRIMFTDNDASNQGKIEYLHSSDTLQLSSNGGNPGYELQSDSKSRFNVVNSKVLIDKNNTGTIVDFDKSGTSVGTISITSSNTSYNTSSDYRLKENVVGITSAITRLKTLKPSRFNFKIDPSVTVDGFLAHEVTAVPEATTGTKDQVATADDVTSGIATAVGDPIYQGIDQSKLVPLLTAALQEAITKIETLETKVAALEGG